jgi:K+-sensing histidine kinase KdpD
VKGYVWTTVLVAAGTALAFFVLIRGPANLPDVAMLYLLIIMMVAAWWGRGPSLLAATLSVAAYDFFFVPPRFTFAVSDVRHVATFITMFVVGVIISNLTLRVRRQAEEHARLGDEARVAAERARTEEMRSSILSAISHDVRTPLAAITGAATTLRASTGTLERDQQADLLDTIVEEATRLERLVANLLQLTRLESGTIHLKRDWVPIEEIVGGALTRLEDELAGRAVEIALPADLPLVSADPVLLEQVFINLFENAAKYAPGSPIDVRAFARDGRVEVEVADRGPGLPAGAEARIFEKFFRAPPIPAAGAGLGLAISRGIVEAHGGRVSAENREGGGAVFRVMLPAGTSAPPLPEEPQSGSTEVEPAA